MHLQPADWVIIAIVGMSMIFGLMRGFVREAFSLAGWVAALIVARMFVEPFDHMLAPHVSTPSVRLALAYSGLFIGTLVVAWLLGYAIMSLVDAAGLKFSDRVLGAVFGFVRGLVIVLALLITLEPFVKHDAWWHESVLPQEFMKYAFLGRKLKEEVIEVTSPADKKDAGGQMPLTMP